MTENLLAVVIYHPVYPSCRVPLYLGMVFFCSVANLEFLDPASSVHATYGQHGLGALPYAWEIEAANQ
ncbi:hypothetical protein Vadar_032158 [Vaccinium darrowii]|uniref:Uncharacterized protein n=1 Tax=Vaccinium darrowii TaxID=229202 RepID=A0ACB7YBE8_9ERIC|nr:hypothetical protein Vadar_032158 [Vaccinium darrowii]